jgi:TetR/AcrR family transcriptional repressor of nem operon
MARQIPGQIRVPPRLNCGVPKPSHRQKLIDAGLCVVRAQGYCGASVRDIVRAAGVPQGSFTNHFRSKEAFGLAVLERYLEMVRRNIAATLLDERRRPLDRLDAWFTIQVDFLNETGMRVGCLIGNLSADAVVGSAAIRERLGLAYDEIHAAIATCLRAAAAAGQLPRPVRDADELARFLYASLQGSVLQAKVEQSPEPLERFRRFAFSTVLGVRRRAKRRTTA